MQEAQSLIEAYPMVESLVTDLQAADGLTTDRTIAGIRRDFDRMGPYLFAQANGLLVNNSGEEFALQFMGFYNTLTGSQTY